MRVLDHAPQPGPGYWDYRCLRCRYEVSAHGNALERWRWRREQRKRLKQKKADAKRIPGFIL